MPYSKLVLHSQDNLPRSSSLLYRGFFRQTISASDSCPLISPSPRPCLAHEFSIHVLIHLEEILEHYQLDKYLISTLAIKQVFQGFNIFSTSPFPHILIVKPMLFLCFYLSTVKIVIKLFQNVSECKENTSRGYLT